MKICPKCSQTYGDESLNFCLIDGAALDRLGNTASQNVQPTEVFSSPDTSQNRGFANTPTSPYTINQPRKKSRLWLVLLLLFGGAAVLIGGGVIALFVIGYDLARTDGTTTRPTPQRTFTPFPTPSVGTTSTPGKGSYNLTMENYNKLYIGMARSEVERILGGKGTSVSDSTGGGIRFTVDKWEGENYKSIILSFRDEKIMTKSQVGLK